MAFLDQPISWTNATGNAAALLDGLQPNIIKSHVRDHLTLLFLTFSNAAGAKSFLKALATRKAGKVLVKSAKAHLTEIKKFKQTHKDNASTAYVGVGLTWTGYDAIGTPIAMRPADASFRKGMKLAKLNDPDPKKWEKEYRGRIDCVVLVGDAENRKARKSAALKAVRDLIRASVGVKEEASQDGLSQVNENGDGIEHFGYVDGRSQPQFLQEEVDDEKLKNDGATNWDPAFAPSRVVVPDPASPSAFGSYFVYRKLEQNVRKFKRAEAALAGRLGLKKDDKERAGAMIVGRFEDGTPVSMQFAEGTHNPVPNDFNYDSDPSGGKCPHFAHIRKVNPRGTGGFEPEVKERLHIMARRGQTYGERPDLKKGAKNAELPTKGVGLLFMAFNANIAEQFEFAQNVWANTKGFPRVPPGTQPPGVDQVIGQLPEGEDRTKISCPLTWGGKMSKPVEPIAQAVTMKGGEYFFMPSLPFLRSL